MTQDDTNKVDPVTQGYQHRFKIFYMEISRKQISGWKFQLILGFKKVVVFLFSNFQPENLGEKNILLSGRISRCRTVWVSEWTRWGWFRWAVGKTAPNKMVRFPGGRFFEKTAYSSKLPGMPNICIKIIKTMEKTEASRWISGFPWLLPCEAVAKLNRLGACQPVTNGKIT